MASLMACKTVQLIALIALIISCSAPSETPVQETYEQIPQQVNLTQEIFPEEQATQTVHQQGHFPAIYGLSKDNRILSIEKSEAVWKFHYDNDKLMSIGGPQTIAFFYNNSKLNNITSEGKTLSLRYDSRGRLIEAKGGRETLYFEYDSLDLLRAVRRGVAGKNSIHDEQKLRH